MRSFEFLTVLLLACAFLQAPTVGAAPNDSVKLEVVPVPGTMHPGTRGIIELRFSPADGIHINTTPAMAFSLDTGATVRLSGNPIVTADSTTGYLVASTPVRQHITVPPDLRPGQHTVRGTVIFYYCSDNEGWCNRQKEPVEFTIFVKP